MAVVYWTIGVAVSVTPASERPAIVLQNGSSMPGSWRAERLPAEFLPMWNRSESLADRHNREVQILPRIVSGSGATQLHQATVRLQV
jgi:hypothetical protein